LRAAVGGPQFQAQQKSTRHQGAVVQPVHELPPEPAALVRAVVRQQIEVGAIVAELHDREASQLAVKAGRQDHAIGALDVAKYAVCRP
jgi:hypothetical protein